MADVFISYSSKDRESARLVAAAIAGLGLSVWWDREILTGQAFDDAIEQELESAKSVIVLWSKDSVSSEWVKTEAAAAAERNVLLPANIDGTKLPLEFRRKQTADLSDWTGDPSHEGFQALCRGLNSVIGGDGLQAKPIALGKTQRQKQRLAIVAVAAVIVLAGAYVGWSSNTAAPKRDVIRSQDSGSIPSESRAPAVATTGLADAVVGTYVGEVISDSQGSSRTNIVVTINKSSANTVRVSSPYRRIGTMDIELTQIDNKILNAGGDTPFIVDLGATLPTLTLDPHSELAYRGTRKR